MRGGSSSCAQTRVGHSGRSASRRAARQLGRWAIPSDTFSCTSSLLSEHATRAALPTYPLRRTLALYSRRRRRPTRYWAVDCHSRCTRVNHAINVRTQETSKARRSRSTERADKATSPLRLLRHTTEHQHKTWAHLRPPVPSSTR
uniref:Uncharacterized protein n=1 Tax=Rhipicephalus zambeziensis TaxID=60191 RepID=A0A224YI26_9ACAR